MSEAPAQKKVVRKRRSYAEAFVVEKVQFKRLLVKVFAEVGWFGSCGETQEQEPFSPAERIMSCRANFPLPCD
jgi:hypothetical protein